jgi:alditol oxidase
MMNENLPGKISYSKTNEGALLPLIDGKTGDAIINWAGNITYSTNKIIYPQSVEEVQAQVQKNAKLKVLGTRHCFNRIADSRDIMLSTKNLNKVVSLDTKTHKVTVEGGIKYGELAPFLHENGYALPNLASLPHISVAGSVITATHGSGVNNGNLATSVVALELVTADGNLLTLSAEKDGENFLGAVVGLGALGVITKVTLAVLPTFMMQQIVYENLPLAELKENFESIVSAGYSVSLFTHWLNDNIDQVWIKSRVGDRDNMVRGEAFFGAKAATQNKHPIVGMSAENCTEQMGVPGPWYGRLPHFKMGFIPSSGVELQSEYFVPFQYAEEAIMAIARLGDQISPYLFVSEIRTIAADDFWMSPCYRQPSVAIHFTWKQDWPAVSKLLLLIEKELAPFNARPHWGKLFMMSPDVLKSRYERLPDFKKLVAHLDPTGKFRNDFLDSTLYSL